MAQSSSFAEHYFDERLQTLCINIISGSAPTADATCHAVLDESVEMAGFTATNAGECGEGGGRSGSHFALEWPHGSLGVAA